MPEIRLISDWRWVLRRAWSVRLLAVAALLSGAEVALAVASAYQIDLGIPSTLFAALAGVVTIAATVARFVAQR